MPGKSELRTDVFDREVAAFRSRLTRDRAPSIRELIEKTQDTDFREKLNELVTALKASSPSGRYPTVAQVRKMLAANDNTIDPPADYSEISAEYKQLFERCLAESGDVTPLTGKLTKDRRVTKDALVAITVALTGKTLGRTTAKTASAAITDEFANRSVSQLAKRAASHAKPF